MNSRKRLFSVSSMLWIFLAAPLWFAAQSPTSEQQEAQSRRPRYKLIDLGTLGGPHTYGSSNGDGARLLNNEGVVSSYSDTSKPDPRAPDFCFNPVTCLLARAFRWKDGVLTDLGALPGMNSSQASFINDRGWSAGLSQTGTIDPLLGAPANHATLWKSHEVIDLGDLGGGESFAVSLNNSGQVVGISDNTVADPFAIIPIGLQNRTFLWDEGHIQDIGTLGGPDALPGQGCSNQRENFIVGQSYTSFTPNSGTGIPTLDPFLWKHGRMIDLGSLGGTIGNAQCANNRGEVIGASNLSGDTIAHAFLWDYGVMKDLGTLGGDTSEAIWINDAGEIAGSADLPDGLHDAVLWKDGIAHDLGTVDGDPCSRGRAINSRGQVVGGSSDCANFLHAFVWQRGEGILDLNKLIAPGSGLQLTNAININDRGEILAKSVPVGVTPVDDEDLGRLVLLVPCDDDHERDCERRGKGMTDFSPEFPYPPVRAAGLSIHHSMTPRENAAAWRAKVTRQYHFPSARKAKK